MRFMTIWWVFIIHFYIFKFAGIFLTAPNLLYSSIFFKADKIPHNKIIYYLYNKRQKNGEKCNKASNKNLLPSCFYNIFYEYTSYSLCCRNSLALFTFSTFFFHLAIFHLVFCCWLQRQFICIKSVEHEAPRKSQKDFTEQNGIIER